MRQTSWPRWSISTAFWDARGSVLGCIKRWRTPSRYPCGWWRKAASGRTTSTNPTSLDSIHRRGHHSISCWRSKASVALLAITWHHSTNCMWATPTTLIPSKCTIKLSSIAKVTSRPSMSRTHEHQEWFGTIMSLWPSIMPWRMIELNIWWRTSLIPSGMQACIFSAHQALWRHQWSRASSTPAWHLGLPSQVHRPSQGRGSEHILSTTSTRKRCWSTSGTIIDPARKNIPLFHPIILMNLWMRSTRPSERQIEISKIEKHPGK